MLDGILYALGGTNGHDVMQVDLDACHRFDPATKQWTKVAALPDGRSHFEGSTIIHKGRILIAGGRCNATKPNHNVVNDMLEYDPKADHWSVVATMPESLMSPSVEIIGNQIVLAGGGLNNPRPLTAATYVAPLPNGE